MLHPMIYSYVVYFSSLNLELQCGPNWQLHLLKPSLGKTKCLSLFPPNWQQAKQKHVSSFAEYSGQYFKSSMPKIPVCLTAHFAICKPARFSGCPELLQREQRQMTETAKKRLQHV